METQTVDWLVNEAEKAQEGQEQGAAPILAELNVLLHDPETGAPTPVIRPLRLGENRIGAWVVGVLCEGVVYSVGRWVHRRRRRFTHALWNLVTQHAQAATRSMTCPSPTAASRTRTPS